MRSRFYPIKVEVESAFAEFATPVAAFILHCELHKGQGLGRLAGSGWVCAVQAIVQGLVDKRLPERVELADDPFGGRGFGDDIAVLQGVELAADGEYDI